MKLASSPPNCLAKQTLSHLSLILHLSQCPVLKEALSLQLLKRNDPEEIFSSIQKRKNYVTYFSWVFLITLPKPTQDEELKEKMKEQDVIREIFIKDKSFLSHLSAASLFYLQALFISPISFPLYSFSYIFPLYCFLYNLLNQLISIMMILRFGNNSITPL